jgi:quercetin dioxygenase-like cupin family protein
MSSYPQPTYLGEGGEVRAQVRPAGGEPDLLLGTTRVRYLATSASTSGQFGLYRWDMGPEPRGARPHFHRSFSESFFVLSGLVEIYDGQSWRDASAGDYAFVPEGGIHGFRNSSGEPASMLILFAPGAPREEYFEGLAAMATGPQLSDEEKAEFFRAHDNHWV